MQVGLATISAGVHRAGGSRVHPGSALDEALEVRAASIEGGASGEAIAMGNAPSHLTYSPLSLYHVPCLLLHPFPPLSSSQIVSAESAEGQNGGRLAEEVTHVTSECALHVQNMSTVCGHWHAEQTWTLSA